MPSYFFDSYAVIELVKGNPNYARFINEEVIMSIFNLAEIYWSSLNDLGEKEADEIYDKYKPSIVEIDDLTLKAAVKFRKANKKKDLSYADCIGYIYSLKHDLIFLTGDNKFNGLEKVEFVK